MLDSESKVYSALDLPGNFTVLTVLRSAHRLSNGLITESTGYDVREALPVVSLRLSTNTFCVSGEN